MRLRLSCVSQPALRVAPTECLSVRPSLVSRGQRNFLIGLLIAAVIGAVVDVILTITAIIAAFTLLYVVAVVYRSYLFTRWSKATRSKS